MSDLLVVWRVAAYFSASLVLAFGGYSAFTGFVPHVYAIVLAVILGVTFPATWRRR